MPAVRVEDTSSPCDFIVFEMLRTEISLPVLSAIKRDRFSMNGTLRISSRVMTSRIIMVL